MYIKETTILSITFMVQHVYIEWKEDGEPRDVVSINSVRVIEDSEIAVGTNVTVRFGRSYFPATILFIGKLLL